MVACVAGGDDGAISARPQPIDSGVEEDVFDQTALAWRVIWPGTASDRREDEEQDAQDAPVATVPRMRAKRHHRASDG
jgi:hypothetical protein